MAESTHLLGTFDKEDCTHCDGNLVTRSYKDNGAIVHDDCGTSVVQL